MNQLLPHEITKIFGRYALAPVWIWDGIGSAEQNEHGPAPAYVEGVHFRTDYAKVCAENTTFDTDKVRLALRPLHHITNNEIIAACRLFDNSGFIGFDGRKFSMEDNDPTMRRLVLHGTPYVYTLDLESGNAGCYKAGRPMVATNNQALLTQWYYEKTFAVPVYFEQGHWANGKTPFELGIAQPSRGLLFELLEKRFNGDKEDISQWFFDHKLIETNLFDLPTLDNIIDELKNEVNQKK